MTELPNTIHLKGLRNVTPSHPPKVWLNNKLLKIEKSLKVKAHTVDGFDWGRPGTGAAQLALAICFEIYPPETAEDAYMAFRDDFLAHIREDSFIMTLDLRSFNKKYTPHLAL